MGAFATFAAGVVDFAVVDLAAVDFAAVDFAAGADFVLGMKEFADVVVATVCKALGVAE